MICKNCGKEVNDNAVVCINCGAATGKGIEGVNQTWLIVLLLAIFLGVLGVHRFYTGHTKIGIIQLVLTLTAVGAIASCIWVILDIVNIATDKFQTADGQLIKK